MRSLLACLVLTTAALAACGDDAEPGGDLGDQLRALPGVRVAEWFPPPQWEPTPGYRYFDLYVTVPIDHDDPGAGTFELYAALMHRDVHAPLVVYAGGYDAGWTRSLTEPARLIAGNQLSLEYRFYGRSRPASGAIPWAQLRVSEAAADEHLVIETLAAIYDGRRIATGGSKGGENALLHHRRYPDDYDGVVAYVAPVITAFPDLRYDGILDRIGTPECRARLRGLARRMLERRDALALRAMDVASYTVAGLDHAFETAVVELEFGFWMTRGEAECGEVPDPVTASDDVLWAFLEDTGSPAAYGDEDLARYGTQYLYQDHVELGYPIWNHAYLDDLLRYSYEDWSAYLPRGEPVAYDPTEARELAAWITDEAEHILIIQGEWDPWAAGAPTVAPGRDAHQLWVPRGSHWSAGIYSLPQPDGDTAIRALRRWAGLDPEMSQREQRDRRALPPAPMATRGPDDPRLRARR